MKLLGKSPIAAVAYALLYGELSKEASVWHSQTLRFLVVLS